MARLPLLGGGAVVISPSRVQESGSGTTVPSLFRPDPMFSVQARSDARADDLHLDRGTPAAELRRGQHERRGRGCSIAHSDGGPRSAALEIAADAQHFVVSHCFGPFLAARGWMVMVAQSPL